MCISWTSSTCRTRIHWYFFWKHQCLIANADRVLLYVVGVMWLFILRYDFFLSSIPSSESFISIAEEDGCCARCISCRARGNIVSWRCPIRWCNYLCGDEDLDWRTCKRNRRYTISHHTRNPLLRHIADQSYSNRHLRERPKVKLHPLNHYQPAWYNVSQWVTSVRFRVVFITSKRAINSYKNPSDEYVLAPQFIFQTSIAWDTLSFIFMFFKPYPSDVTERPPSNPPPPPALR